MGENGTERDKGILQMIMCEWAVRTRLVFHVIN